MAQRNTSIRGEQIRDAFFGAALIRNATDNNICDINVDDSSIEISADALQIKALGVTTGMLGANVVNAAKLDETDNYTFSGTFAVATPTLAGQAATKGYVDGLVNGVNWKNSVRVATTGNVALTGEQTIDGILTSADRVLVKAQTVDSENGIYVTAAGAWARAADYASGDTVASTAMFVEEGTAAADTGWVCTNDQGDDTVATHDLAFTQFTGIAELIAGIGLVKTTNTIDLDLDTLTAAAVDVAADSIAIADATDGVTKQESIADLITAIAGDGLAATSGVLAVDLNELSTEATFDPAADFASIVDATDSGSDKTLWSVIATAIAGTGITATNGVLSADSVADQIGEADFVKNVETATASQTVMATFSGSAAVVANSVHVYLNGMLQEEGGGADYTINVSTGVVTFVVGLDAGDVVTSTGVLNN